MANDTEFGLASYFYSPRHRPRLARRRGARIRHRRHQRRHHLDRGGAVRRREGIRHRPRRLEIRHRGLPRDQVRLHRRASTRSTTRRCIPGRLNSDPREARRPSFRCPNTTTICSPSAPARAACARAAGGRLRRAGRASPRSAFGGTCVNVGCIPKKLFAYAAHFRTTSRTRRLRLDRRRARLRLADAGRQQGQGDRAAERRLRAGCSTSAGVEIFEGARAARDAHTVEVGGKTVTAEHILVATGGWPACPTSRARSTRSPPTRSSISSACRRASIVVGGGYIAVEFAGIFNGLGVEVTSSTAATCSCAASTTTCGSSWPRRCARRASTCASTPTSSRIEQAAGDAARRRFDDGARTLEADAVLYATGRVPNTHGLGLEEAGVKLAPDGAVVVDDYFRSSGAVDLRHRRRDRPHEAHAGGDRRRRWRSPNTLFHGKPTDDGLRRTCRPRCSANPNVGTRGPDRGAGARALWPRCDGLPADFRPLQAHAHRQRRAAPS